MNDNRKNPTLETAPIRSDYAQLFSKPFRT